MVQQEVEGNEKDAIRWNSKDGHGHWNKKCDGFSKMDIHGRTASIFFRTT